MKEMVVDYLKISPRNVTIQRLAFLSRIRSSRVQISAWKRAILTEIFRGFLQSFQDNTSTWAMADSFHILSNSPFTSHSSIRGYTV
jgi:hypothetical protein